MKLKNALVCILILFKAFGVGAFEEEDENIYGAEDMSEYDFALSSEKEPRHLGWSGPPRKDKEKGMHFYIEILN